MTESPDWRLDALCAQFDPDMWFSEDGKRTKLNEFALKMCGQCPVKKVCLENALDQERDNQLTNSLYGTRGGKTAKQRAEMLRMENRVGRNLVDSTPHAA